jgi:DNA-directed RNA polymerase specialized sigma24 family protein
MPKKEYFVPVFSNATGKFETVCLDKQQYDAFRRGEWDIEYRDAKFYKKEIQFSQLIGGNGRSDCGGEDSAGKGPALENFREFLTHDDDPQWIVDRRATSEILADALLELGKEDIALILALCVFEKTEREYAKEIGAHNSWVHRRKEKILKTLRKRLGRKIL